MDERDVEFIKEARPYLRSAVALVIYLRYGPWDKVLEPFETIYETADKFVDQLEKDVTEASAKE